MRILRTKSNNPAPPLFSLPLMAVYSLLEILNGNYAPDGNESFDKTVLNAL